MSAAMALQSVAIPPAAIPRKRIFTASEKKMFCWMTARVRLE
jgi:hypothetical protein